MMVGIYYKYNRVLCLVYIQSHSRICLYALILLCYVLPDTHSKPDHRRIISLR